jgi:hypothetical protein
VPILCEFKPNTHDVLMAQIIFIPTLGVKSVGSDEKPKECAPLYRKNQTWLLEIIFLNFDPHSRC